MPVNIVSNKSRRINPVAIKNEFQGTAVKSTSLIYEYPEIPDERSVYHSSTKGTKWQLNFRHILPDGVSLPLKDSTFDRTKGDDEGWTTFTWHTT